MCTPTKLLATVTITLCTSPIWLMGNGSISSSRKASAKAFSLNTSSVPEPRTKVANFAMVGSSMKRLIEMLRPNFSRNRSNMRDNRIE
ncbi:hypothetical protein D3C85_1678110 [compost metagenome]